MRCGHCPLVTATSRTAGGSSRRHSRAGCHRGERVSASRLRKRERAIWQRRFWEHTIRELASTLVVEFSGGSAV
jgi:hypothetical protein